MTSDIDAHRQPAGQLNLAGECVGPLSTRQSDLFAPPRPADVKSHEVGGSVVDAEEQARKDAQTPDDGVTPAMFPEETRQ